MPQPKLSGMLRGQFRGLSEVKVLECLNRLERAYRCPQGFARTGEWTDKCGIYMIYANTLDSACRTSSSIALWKSDESDESIFDKCV